MDARNARDDALDTVTGNNAAWHDTARARVRQLPVGWKGTGEDIRLLFEADGLVPNHHNAWGGMINGCVRDGVLVWVHGVLSQMKTEKSHARSTRVYERVRTAQEALHMALRG